MEDKAKARKKQKVFVVQVLFRNFTPQDGRT